MLTPEERARSVLGGVAMIDQADEDRLVGQVAEQIRQAVAVERKRCLEAFRQAMPVRGPWHEDIIAAISQS